MLYHRVGAHHILMLQLKIQIFQQLLHGLNPEEKVNMTDGRANYALGPTTYQDFLKSALEKQAERDKAIAGMDNLINLQALGRVGQALSTEESNNPLDIIKNNYNASLSTIRETLNRLASEGFVKAEEQRGFFVKSFKKEDLIEGRSMAFLME